MGGLGPGIGGFEIVVIGLVALLVVGPKDLPVLMRRVGQMVAKARAMANEFRSSFDEMARQSELDDLRKEVEALRSGQGMYNLGADAEAAFKDIRDDLNKPADASPPPMPEFPDPSAEPATLAQAERAGAGQRAGRPGRVRPQAPARQDGGGRAGAHRPQDPRQGPAA